VFASVRAEAARQAAGNVLEPLYPAFATALRHAMYRVGADVTTSVAERPCLVVAPHPDDETLGAAATIMRKLAAGTPVRVVIATDGSKSPSGDQRAVAKMRTIELLSACHILGLSDEDVTRLPFVDAELEGEEDALVAAIADAVGRFNPAEVLTTADTDPHDDHAIVGAAARRALLGTGVRLLTYPVWQWERPPRLARTLWRSGRPELVRTDGYLSRKLDAIAAYGSQLAAPGGPEGLEPAFLRHFEGPYEIFFPAVTP
jgi:LmbE family N-acetylglucosaminyl deacetylase